MQSTHNKNDLIILNNVELTLADQNIFNGISLNITHGEKVALLGDSGVGKSSLLKLIAGIYQPTTGAFSNKAQRIGYVFQEPRLLPWLTVEENIVEAMKAHNIPEFSREKKLTELLEQVELAKYKLHYPHQLSGGMAQRVSLARAFAIKPDLLLLDEPFSALDSTLIKQLTQLLSQFLTKHITMIYVSHHVKQVLPLTQSSVMFHHDHKAQEGKLTKHSTASNNERECFLNQFYQ
jgi:NitT/TauT family transport system ATP-binding protein